MACSRCGRLRLRGLIGAAVLVTLTLGLRPEAAAIKWRAPGAMGLGRVGRALSTGLKAGTRLVLPGSRSKHVGFGKAGLGRKGTALTMVMLALISGASCSHIQAGHTAPTEKRYRIGQNSINVRIMVQLPKVRATRTSAELAQWLQANQGYLLELKGADPKTIEAVAAIMFPQRAGFTSMDKFLPALFDARVAADKALN